MFEVYKITNIVNNKVYIGITNQGHSVRYRHHIYEANSGSTFKVHRAFAKYGEENMKIEVLDNCICDKSAKLAEISYIKEYNSMNDSFGYNMTTGGDGTFGRKHSEETKAKIREKAIGRKATEETKSRMRKARENFVAKQHVINNLQIYNQAKRKTILRYSKEGELIEKYLGITDLCKKYGYDRTMINKALSGKYKYAYGFIWKCE